MSTFSPSQQAFLKINQMLCNSSINLMQMDEHLFLCIFCMNCVVKGHTQKLCKCSFTPLTHELVAIGTMICFRKIYKFASHLYVIHTYIHIYMKPYKLKFCCYSVPMQQVILMVKIFMCMLGSNDSHTYCGNTKQHRQT